MERMISKTMLLKYKFIYNIKAQRSAPGRITIDNKGFSHYSSAVAGKHYYLQLDTEIHDKIMDKLIEAVAG